MESRSIAPRRAQTVLLAGLSALAIALAAVGIYGVVAYAVGQRIHEIGIRRALGASEASIVSMVVREGMGLVLEGLLRQLAARRCNNGSTNPAVLPVPVCAPARRSPPFNTAGIACNWMGVGVV